MTIRELDNEESFKHLVERYGQVLAGIKMLIPRLKAKELGRVVEVFASLPFVAPTKSPGSEDEKVLLQGLISLGDIRYQLLELVDENGKVKPNEQKVNTESSSNPSAE